MAVACSIFRRSRFISQETIRASNDFPARSTRWSVIIMRPNGGEGLRTHIRMVMNAGFTVILKEISETWLIEECIESKLWIPQNPENTCFASLPKRDNTLLF